MSKKQVRTRAPGQDPWGPNQSAVLLSHVRKIPLSPFQQWPPKHGLITQKDKHKGFHLAIITSVSNVEKKTCVVTVSFSRLLTSFSGSTLDHLGHFKLARSPLITFKVWHEKT